MDEDENSREKKIEEIREYIEELSKDNSRLGGMMMQILNHVIEDKDAMVVNWEQSGSGKSYNCMNRKDITVDTYIQDGIFVTEYLRERFDKEQKRGNQHEGIR